MVFEPKFVFKAYKIKTMYPTLITQLENGVLKLMEAIREA